MCFVGPAMTNPAEELFVEMRMNHSSPIESLCCECMTVVSRRIDATRIGMTFPPIKRFDSIARYLDDLLSNPDISEKHNLLETR